MCDVRLVLWILNRLVARDSVGDDVEV